MQRSAFISLAIVVCLQFSLGCTEDVAANNNNEASQETALSRAKRGGYDMARLGRGLHMLRLGKRNDESPDHDVESLDDAFAFLQAYNEQHPENFGAYDSNLSEEGVEIPVHYRYRRSTPAANGPVHVERVQQINTAPKGIFPADLNAGNEEEVLVNFPDDNNVYLADDLEDDIIGSQEGDKESSTGYAAFPRMGKRQLSMLRLGKRSLGMLRLGKRDPEDDEEKRSLGMLRLGKRQLSMLRLGKRSLGMLRLGKREDENVDEDYNEEESLLQENNFEEGKRPMSMLRLGKRPMSMLRLGKRPMSMLRLGKRPMSMLRLGKRPMSMLRLGKRPMSMLRLGKREDEQKRSTR